VTSKPAISIKQVPSKPIQGGKPATKPKSAKKVSKQKTEEDIRQDPPQYGLYNPNSGILVYSIDRDFEDFEDFRIIPNKIHGNPPPEKKEKPAGDTSMSRQSEEQPSPGKPVVR